MGLDYRIGRIVIERNRIRNVRAHKFVVLAEDNWAKIYAGCAEGGKELAEKFELDEPKIHGEGYFHMEFGDRLRTRSFRGDYPAVPWEVLRDFTMKIFVPELTNRGFHIEGVSISNVPGDVGKYWEKFGFK